jgi:hypothetical protein
VASILAGLINTRLPIIGILAGPMSTRMLIVLAALCAVAILAASAIQILVAR